ncbi:SDR family NAD(P)-dependent oxidoreductase [Methylobacterium sp. Gmos1]
MLDVTDFDTIPEAVAGIEREVGPVDVLVNNAGYRRSAASSTGCWRFASRCRTACSRRSRSAWPW